MKQTHLFRRAAALATALILAFCFIFSFTFMGANADHECLSPEECPICTEMNLCGDLMHAFGTAAPTDEEERPAAAGWRIERRPAAAAPRRFAATPVSLKVKITS